MMLAPPTITDVSEALLEFIEKGTSVFSSHGQPDRLGWIAHQNFYYSKPAKLSNGIWLIDAIHQVESPSGFPAKLDAIIKVLPASLDAREIRHHLLNALVASAIADTLNKDTHLRAIWDLIKANPRTMHELRLSNEGLDDIQRFGASFGRVCATVSSGEEYNVCYLAHVAISSTYEILRDIQQDWAIVADEVRYLNGVFAEGASEKAKRALHSNLQFLMKHNSNVASMMQALYARHLAGKAANGADHAGVDKKLIQMIYNENNVEAVYKAVIKAFRPQLHGHRDAFEYKALLEGAESMFSEIKTTLKLPRHDEMLAHGLNANQPGDRLDSTAHEKYQLLFQWAGRVANNWPVIVTALLSWGGNQLEFRKAQKATQGSACRLAMGYLINPGAVSKQPSAKLKSLATVFVQDNYSLKIAGLVLHAQKDRNAAIEKLYQVTHDPKLLELMKDTSLENSLASELGL